MRDIYVISDTHFGHNNIIKYCGRPFKDSDEMDQVLIDNWNKTVKNNDIVYHLGDVFMSLKREKYGYILKNVLKGHKRLVVGNHDDLKDKYLMESFEKVMLWRMFPEFQLLFTHVPVHETSLFRGATGNEENPPKLRNIHGHIHEKNSPSKDHFNVSVERINYTPISIEELRKN